MSEPDGQVKKPGTSPARRRRLSPPIGVWLPCLTLAAGIVYIRAWTVTGDHAIVNILTLVLGAISVQFLGVWFIFRSGYASAVRYGALLAAVAGIGLFFAFFRVHHVSGEMVPVFRYRFALEPDELLDAPVATAPIESIDLTQTSARDFPQFLGPLRDARIDHVQLDPDWKQRPPRLVWRQPIGAGWSAFVAVQGLACTMEQRGEEELVTAYNIENGNLVWSYGIPARHHTILGGVGPRSTPTIADGKVYSLGATGHVACLDGATGKAIWTDDLLQRYGVTPEEDITRVAWGRSNSPLVLDDLVVVPAGGPMQEKPVSLIAYDKLTGDVIWESGEHLVSYASPSLATLAGRDQIVSVNQDIVSGHDVADGTILWQHPWPGKSNADASNSQPVILQNSRVLLSKGYGGGATLLELSSTDTDSISVSQLWKDSSVMKTKFTNVVVHDGHIYGLSDGILECVEIATGQRRWKRGRYGHGQILGVGDFLLLQSEDGEVILLDATPDRLRERGTFPALDGKTWNNPCLYGNLLLVRNAEEAGCYELPTE
jgi:outer membrane protein assembly factor BamB